MELYPPLASSDLQMTQSFAKQDDDVAVDEATLEQVDDFYEGVPTLEKRLGRDLILLYDEKTKAVYVECHISAKTLIGKMDLDATVDPEHQEEYRANRQLQPDNLDYLKMVEDAKNGRQFSDIIIEYNKLYRTEKPLKIIGGQHRSAAIRSSVSVRNRYHGIKVYFNLNTPQRVELYTVSNTNIQVPDDLFDRIEEQSLLPPDKLRKFAREIGILVEGEDFAERKLLDEPKKPTVRILRTFVVDFYKGREDSARDFDSAAIIPYLCNSGARDDEYHKVFDKIGSFVDEADLMEAGRDFTKLHLKQFKEADKLEGAGKKEFRMKALTPAIVSSWAYAAGLLQKDKVRLAKLYSLPDRSGSSDPLNAQAMSQARVDIDPEGYRGLGTRSEPSERGRLLQLFLLYSKSDKDKITIIQCNAAIKKFIAEDAHRKAETAMKKAFG